MTTEASIRRYKSWYARLLRLYPIFYHKRFSEGMSQTFADLLRERAEEDKGLFAYTVWIFAETFACILKENMTMLVTQNKNIVRLALITACLLLVPLVAMQFSDEVTWTLFDFVFAGGLIFGTGLVYTLVTSKFEPLVYRAAVGLALAAGFVLTWANGAVGIIGSEANPANLLYSGVLVVGVLGALISRLQAAGMARTLFGMAVVQALVPATALVVWKSQVAALGVLEVWGPNTVFVLLFLGSALLFWQTDTTGHRVKQGLEQ